MSASIFQEGGAGSAPSAPLVTGAGLLATPRPRHLVDLAAFFRPDSHRIPDALVAETRRHLAGGVSTVETGLLFELAAHGEIGAAAETLEKGYCWAALQAQPQLLSAGLLAHMRSRAALSLLARKDAPRDGEEMAPAGDDLGWLLDDGDSAVEEAALGLLLSENRWSEMAGVIALVPADLPSAHYAELVWIAATLLTVAVDRVGVADRASLSAVVAAAAERLLARHDEEKGPVARAMILARLLGERPDVDEQVRRMLGHRRYLLFTAMVAERAGIAVESLMDAWWQAPPETMLAMCRLLDCGSVQARQMLGDLRSVRCDLGDERLLHLAFEYDAMSDGDAEMALAPLRLPPPFREKLGLLAGVAMRERGV